MSKRTSSFMTPTWYKAIRLFKTVQEMGGIIGKDAVFDCNRDQNGNLGKGLRIYIPHFKGETRYIIAEFSTQIGMIRWLEACKAAGKRVPTTPEATQKKTRKPQAA